MAAIYTKVDNDLNDLIDQLAADRKEKKSDVIKDLLKTGIEAKQNLQDLENLKDKNLENLTDTVIDVSKKLNELCAKMDTIEKAVNNPKPVEPKEVELEPEHFSDLIEHAKTCEEPNCPHRELWNNEVKEAIKTTNYQCKDCGEPFIGIETREQLRAFEKCPSCGSEKAKRIR